MAGVAARAILFYVKTQTACLEAMSGTLRGGVGRGGEGWAQWFGRCGRLRCNNTWATHSPLASYKDAGSGVKEALLQQALQARQQGGKGVAQARGEKCRAC